MLDDFDFSEIVKSNVLYKTPKVEVYEANLNGAKLCCKDINITDSGINKAVEEVRSIVELKHPGIVKIYWAGVVGSKFVIVQELLKNDLEKEIFNRISKGIYWSELDLVNHLCNLIDVLAHMQSRNYSHRDIKPQNILVTDQGRLKLADFGNARDLAQDSTFTIAGTPAYLSPELRAAYRGYTSGMNGGTIKHNPYKSDVYSLGLTFLYMASMRTIIDCDSHDKILVRINALNFGMIKDIITWMLQYEITNRPDFITIKEWLMASGYLKTIKNILGEYTDIIQNPKNLKKYSYNNLKFKVHVPYDKLENANKLYFDYLYTNTNDDEAKSMCERIMLALSRTETWILYSVCGGCGYGIPECYCNNCGLSFHKQCLHKEIVSTKYNDYLSYQCNNHCQELYKEIYQRKCFKCLKFIDNHLWVTTCHHTFCNNCITSHIEANTNKNSVCIVCPFKFDLVDITPDEYDL
jgi:serine/threonine protein kinase